MVRERLKRLFRKEHSDKHIKEDVQSSQGDQPVDSSTVHAPTPLAKPDLWQRAFNSIEPKQQQLINSILIPKSDKTIDSDHMNTDPGVVDRLEALHEVTDTVKTQYEIDLQKSKIKEPAQKIIKAVLSFSEAINTAVILDPTGHATSVWAIVDSGFKMTQNYHTQKVAWLESSAYLADVLARYSFMEGEYQKNPNTDQYVEKALVQVYGAVLTFAAQVQSLHNRSRAVLIWKSTTGDLLSDLQNSIDEAESHLSQWLEICDRREQRDRGKQLLEKADKILTKIDQAIASINRFDDKMVFAELKVAEEAHYNANTGEECEECLQNTRAELLQDIKSWAPDPDRKPVFWLQGMAGTGKSTVSRTVARWLDDEGLLGGSFFFKKGGADRGDAKRLFTTLAKQIVERLPLLKEPVKKAIEETYNIGSINPRDQFDKLLFKPLNSFSLGLKAPLILVVVIDALDECQVASDVAAFLSTLPKLNDLKDIQLRFFITSRPEPPVIKGFRPIDKDKVILHEIKISIIEHDISLYLREKLNSIRDDHELEESWPGEETFRALVNIAVPLFIYAATIYRFICAEDALPEERLQAVLSSHSGDGTEGIDGKYSKLTGIYLPILKHIVSLKQPNELKSWMCDFQHIVGTIIVLFSPLSLASLAELICLERRKVQARLSPLQSVLSVPKEKDATATIQLLHLSFREFLVDRTASDIFWIDEPAGHIQIAKKCLESMRKELKRDICRLSKPSVMKNEIEETVIERHIPPQLRYACRYWVRHLENGDPSLINWELIDDFLRSHFLHWVEAMSLLGWCSETIGNITTLQSLTKVSQLGDFLSDAKRFILQNRLIAEIAPLQIYYSGLVFAPLQSIIRRINGAEMPPWIQILPNVEDQWSALQQTLEGNSGSVKSVVFSPNGRLLASAFDYMTINLWEAATGALQQTLEGHSDTVNFVAFSPNGQVLASASDDKTIKLWETATGTLQQTLAGNSSQVKSLAFSPDGRLIASASDDGIKAWEMAIGELQQTLEVYSSQVRSVTFSPDGRLLASASDNSIELWEMATGTLQQTLEGHFSQVKSVAFSPDGRLLASASDDHTIKLWEAATGTLQQTLEGHSGCVNFITFSPDGQLLASASDESIDLWEAATGALQQKFKGHSHSVNSVAFSPNGLVLASASSDNTIKLWETATYAPQQILEGHSDWVRLVAFSPDGRVLASASSDTTIKLWETATGALQQTLEGHSDWIPSVAFSPDSRVLASASDENTILLWDAATGSLQQTLEGHSDWVRSVAFSPDGRLLASASYDQTVKLWEAATGVVQQTLETQDYIDRLKFSSSSPCLETNLGVLNILPSYNYNKSLETVDKTQIQISRDHWVALSGEKVLWLPHDYRPFCWVARNRIIALGQKSGRISFLKFL
ncbi:unnamed protein product [Penicillium glandicola]